MKMKLHHLSAAMTLAFASLAAQATPVVVDVSGAQSINKLLEAGNTVWLIDIGAHALLNSVEWSVTLNAFGPSLLSEMELSFGDSSANNLVTLTPGGADAASGSGSYSGFADLSGLGLSVGADGKLHLEFSESFKDAATGVAEGQWTGTLTFDVTPAAAAVPEPSSVALVLAGLGLVAGARRLRQG